MARITRKTYLNGTGDVLVINSEGRKLGPGESMTLDREDPYTKHILDTEPGLVPVSEKNGDK